MIIYIYISIYEYFYRLSIRTTIYDHNQETIPTLLHYAARYIYYEESRLIKNFLTNCMFVEPEQRGAGLVVLQTNHMPR